MRKFYLLTALLILIKLSYSQDWKLSWYNTDNSLIPSNNVAALALDHNDTLWVGTTSGIGRCKDNHWSTTLVNDAFYHEITNIWPTGDSTWIGTEYSGLWQWYDNEWTDYDPNSAGQGIVGFTIGENDTLFRLDKFGGFTKLIGDSWETIRDNIIIPTFLFNDSHNNIWLGSDRSGLFKYHKGSMFIYHNSAETTQPDYIPANNLICMTKDKEGNLWIGTGNGKLLRFDGVHWLVIPIVSNAKILDIDVDKNNTLWMGTDQGIMRYSNGDWLIFNTANSFLPDNRVEDVLVENEDKIWTNTGYNQISSPHGGKGLICLTDKTGGIISQMKKKYLIHPNPSNGIIQIELPDKPLHDVTVSIVDVRGKTISCQSQNKSKPVITVDLSNFKDGMYFIHISYDNFNLTDKIIKMN